ncbi:MAG: hypothetical protein EZS28_026487 [Streblomastix strix]|uniref:Uncharacterized protein n=1 Tax=Streblomastix strix TaxID=222440 RepID=A0A5J4V7A1_9EUKA|nr:MAG: hypothetical protein EZS28_026487 [Streblomastix strix]
MQKLLKVGYTGFWSGDFGETPKIKDDQGVPIFIIPSALDIQTVIEKRDTKRRQEQKQYDNAMAKIKAKKKPTFGQGKTLENARLLHYEFENDLDDYVIEDEGQVPICSLACIDESKTINTYNLSYKMQDGNEIQENLLKFRPFSHGFMVCTDFKSYRSGAYKCTKGQLKKGQAVLLVGWDIWHQVKI